MPQLTKQDMHRLFSLLNDELRDDAVVGELYLVGGAVMCLVFGARGSTHDIDAFFLPAHKVRDAAARVTAKAGVSDKWLNDAVKGFLSDKGSFDAYLELSNLRVFCARPDYLLAMKCLAMRIGAEFHDEGDVRYLLRTLNIETNEEALAVITQYYPLERFPQKTLFALQEILAR